MVDASIQVNEFGELKYQCLSETLLFFSAISQLTLQRRALFCLIAINVPRLQD